MFHDMFRAPITVDFRRQFGISHVFSRYDPILGRASAMFFFPGHDGVHQRGSDESPSVAKRKDNDMIRAGLLAGAARMVGAKGLATKGESTRGHLMSSGDKR